jgi:hypothetical protein
MAGIEISPGKPGSLVVKFQYSEAAIAAIKQIPGRQWNPEGKYWTVPDTSEARTVGEDGGDVDGDAEADGGPDFCRAAENRQAIWTQTAPPLCAGQAADDKPAPSAHQEGGR